MRLVLGKTDFSWFLLRGCRRESLKPDERFVDGRSLVLRQTQHFRQNLGMRRTRRRRSFIYHFREIITSFSFYIIYIKLKVITTTLL